MDGKDRTKKRAIHRLNKEKKKKKRDSQGCERWLGTREQLERYLIFSSCSDRRRACRCERKREAGHFGSGQKLTPTRKHTASTSRSTSSRSRISGRKWQQLDKAGGQRSQSTASRVSRRKFATATVGRLIDRVVVESSEGWEERSSSSSSSSRRATDGLAEGACRRTCSWTTFTQLHCMRRKVDKLQTWWDWASAVWRSVARSKVV